MEFLRQVSPMYFKTSLVTIFVKLVLKGQRAWMRAKKMFCASFEYGHTSGLLRVFFSLSLCVLGVLVKTLNRASLVLVGGSRVTDRNGHVTRTNGNGFPYNKCSFECDGLGGYKPGNESF